MIARVMDERPGVPNELMPRVFTRYARGPRSTGLGIGSYLAERIAKAHGDSLTLDSSTTGATLSLRLRPATASSTSLSAVRAHEWIAPLSAGAAAGMVAGAIAGIGARAAMRMVADGVADGVGIRPEFTLAGTLAIVVFGMIIGAPVGALYNAIAHRLRGPALARGLLFGVGLLAVIGPFFLRTEEFFSLGRVMLFVPLFLVFGVVLGITLGPSRAAMARLPLAVQGLPALAAVGTAVLIAFALVMTALGLPSGFVM